MLYANGADGEGENKSLVNDFYVSAPIDRMNKGAIYKQRSLKTSYSLSVDQDFFSRT